MNSEKIAHIAQRIRHTRADSSLCATFHLAEEPSKWIQYGDDRINAAYPFHRNPGALVATLGGELESWEAKKYVTVLVAKAEVTAVACWIDTYFRWVLAACDATMTLKLSRFQRSCDRV